MANAEHLVRLKEGVDAWNRWRRDYPDESPDLSGAELKGARLRGFNLAGVDLEGANLRRATLRRANLTECILRNANLRHSTLADVNFTRAQLEGANLTKAYLRGANFTGAALVDARLERAVLVNVTLNDADLSGARVHGTAAWDLETNESTKQKNLVITGSDQPVVTVDDLEVAQFIYLMLRNDKIRKVLTTIGQKGVLILGRFTLERKTVLDAIRETLRQLNYVPMMFDFEKADDRSFTETIKILAGMSKFIIADVTNPSSAPLELEAIVPDYMVPLVPIIEKGAEPFSMLADLQQRDWVLAVKEYRTVEHLTGALESGIIAPALKKHAELRLKKAREIQIESLPD